MRKTLIGVIAAAGLSQPAQAEVVRSGPEGFVIRQGATVSAAQADVWRELVKPAGWWDSRHTYSGDAANLWIDSQATGCFCEKLPLPKDAPEGLRPGSVEHMRIIYAEPPRALRMSGGLGPLQAEAVTGTMTIALSPLPQGGTRILLEYVVGGFMRQKPEDLAVAVDKVLGEQVAALAARIDPQPPATGGEGAAAPQAPAAPEVRPAG